MQRLQSPESRTLVLSNAADPTGQNRESNSGFQMDGDWDDSMRFGPSSDEDVETDSVDEFDIIDRDGTSSCKSETAKLFLYDFLDHTNRSERPQVSAFT